MLSAFLLLGCSGGAQRSGANPTGWYPLPLEQAAVRVVDPVSLGLHENSVERRHGPREIIERSRWGMRLGSHASFELRARSNGNTPLQSELTDEVQLAWGKTTQITVGEPGKGANDVGTYQYCRFSATPDRSCVYVRQDAPLAAGSSEVTLRGWYCAAPSTRLSEVAAQSFLNAYKVDAAKLLR